MKILTFSELSKRIKNINAAEKGNRGYFCRHRGGVYKIHVGRNNTVPTKDKVYDYLWIGKNSTSDGIGVGKDFRQYFL